MIRVFDFECAAGHRSERFVQDNTDSVPCDCGLPAARQLSAPAISLDGASGHFPGAAMKWERDHEKAAKKSDHNNPDYVD